MAASSLPVRGDVVYLRRRVKPVPVPAPVESGAQADATPVQLPASMSAPLQPSASRSVGLDLRPTGSSQNLASRTAAPGQSAAEQRPQRPRRPERPERADPFPAPSVSSVWELGDDEPVLRLNARESGIGSLIVRGAACVVWESTDLVTGSRTVDGIVDGTVVVTTGNRELVGYDDADVVVALRHVRTLRRALFIGDGTGLLGVQLFDGSTVAVGRGDETRVFVLSLLQVDGLLELRAEPVARTCSTEAILHDFGFTMTAHVAVRDIRRR